MENQNDVNTSPAEDQAPNSQPGSTQEETRVEVEQATSEQEIPPSGSAQAGTQSRPGSERGGKMPSIVKTISDKQARKYETPEEAEKWQQVSLRGKAYHLLWVTMLCVAAFVIWQSYFIANHEGVVLPDSVNALFELGKTVITFLLGYLYSSNTISVRKN